ncbi:unnamed protein product [Trichobilharzia regenti]|nr:unnamed protein product [Trichobilharzia regenti]
MPWLGQFSHLAPVTDFAGSQLYDDVNDTSPFPVRTPDYLSYKTVLTGLVGVTNTGNQSFVTLSDQIKKVASWMARARVMHFKPPYGFNHRLILADRIMLEKS